MENNLLYAPVTLVKFAVSLLQDKRIEVNKAIPFEVKEPHAGFKYLTDSVIINSFERFERWSISFTSPKIKS